MTKAQLVGLPRDGNGWQEVEALGYDIKAETVGKPVNEEIGVEREDSFYAQPLREGNERGVGQIHRQIVIFVHELFRANAVVWQEVVQRQIAGLPHSPPRPHCVNPTGSVREMHGLGEAWPTGEKRFIRQELGQRNTVHMARIAAIDQCNEWPRIDENHKWPRCFFSTK